MKLDEIACDIWQSLKIAKEYKVFCPGLDE